MKYKALIALLALAACTSANGPLASQLDNYHARKIDALVSVLGPPSTETAIGGEEVFIWGDPRLAVLPQMDAAAAPAPASGASRLECTIRVFVGPDQRITSWDVLGNDATCAPYRARFSNAG